MFKKFKHIVYKSTNTKEIKSEARLKFVIGFFCAVLITAIVLAFLLFPLENVNLPTFYLNSLVWAGIFAFILITGCTSFTLITSQGANRKTFIYFFICICLLALNFCIAHIFHLFYVCLFVCAFLIYFAFLLLHEIRKTNLTAYYLFIPFCIFSIYNCTIYYFIAMLN